MTDVPAPASRHPLLWIDRLTLTYGRGTVAKQAIAEVGFTVGHGELVCVVGPSGAGKTTLLKCVSGLLAPTSGSVTLDGREVTEPPEQVALIFQDYSRSLLPWMSALGNVALPLRAKGVSKIDAKQQARQMLAAVGLGSEVETYPWQLSGGMQQRVAIARGLAYQPDVLLMDEPFASVDAQTRMELEDLVLRLRTQFDLTVVFVTHDIDEAVYLADRVVVLSPGPARVIDVITIELPAPRDQITTRASPAFTQHRANILKHVLHKNERLDQR